MAQDIALDSLSQDDPETTVCEDVIRSIKGQLLSGTLKPGDRLPSERDLAEKMGIGRNTVREAQRTLTLMGVLEKRGAAGTRVARSGAGVLEEPFHFLLLLEDGNLQELFEMRELIEVHTAGHAAEQRTNEDLEAIERTLLPGPFGTDATNTLSSPRRNREFHRAVARAAHNTFAERLICAIIDARNAYIEAVCPDRRGWVQRHEAHERIYRAIRAGDSIGARRAMSLDMAMAHDFWDNARTPEEGSTQAQQIGMTAFTDEVGQRE